MCPPLAADAEGRRPGMRRSFQSWRLERHGGRPLRRAALGDAIESQAAALLGDQVAALLGFASALWQPPMHVHQLLCFLGYTRRWACRGSSWG